MTEINQFGSGVPGDAQVCARCEALLMDALDHTASPEDQAFFDRHLASCVSCSRMFMDAKRGAAWLEMLRDPRPEPSSTLLSRILAQTSAQSGGQVLTTVPIPAEVTSPIFPQAPAPYLLPPSLAYPPATAVPVAARVLPFRPRSAAYTFTQRMLQPRLAMTAAMAFFSIALTLNLTGVRLSELSASDLRPSTIRRGFHQANAHVVRYYDNLRVVYELEARVHDLQRTSDADTAQPAKPDSAQPTSAPGPEDQKPARKPGPGTSLREPLLPDQQRYDRAIAALDPPFRSLSPGTPQASSLAYQTSHEGDRS